MKRLPFIILVSAISFIIGCKGKSGSGSEDRSASEAKALKMNIDALPDMQTEAYLESLPPAQPDDSLFENLTIMIKGQAYSLKTYTEARQYQKSHHGAPGANPPAEFAPFLSLPPAQTTLLDLYASFRVSAIKMCGTFNWSDGDPHNPKIPKQTKIAYSWGSKQYTERGNPTDSCKAYSVHGLDCSGFVSQIFADNNIFFGDDSYVGGEIDPDNLHQYIQPLFGKSSVKATDLGETTTFNTGDIIYFLNPDTQVPCHIGIVYVNSEGTVNYFATSGGTKCFDSTCCVTNLHSGPTVRTLITGGPLMGRDWGVVRLSVDESPSGQVQTRGLNSIGEKIAAN